MFLSLKLLARQGLAIRGDTPTEGNLIQLLKRRAEDVPELARWLQRREKFVSPEIQNEMLKIMAHEIQRDIIKEIQASKVFSSIMDECRDEGNLEQLSICIRSVDLKTLQAVEHFMGFYTASDTKGQSLKEMFIDSLTRMTFDVSDQRDQCYVGGSNMRGRFKGVQALNKELQLLALYVHSFNHSLNLGIQDSLNSLPFAREALQWTHDVGVIIERSPKRQTRFDDIRASMDDCSDGVGP
ncbi:hypothetical protein ONE63_008203 [Megalurothrips usitatus]|uniref:DUF4371 domain-containing protein n=1 Tax=Megalurothrips usitatus TaxID=439358 RepID=A0AAV7XLE9_9NEOP|nr:hypothetical protein ONE63_008203 [Megalurothrips usitatus]